MTTITFSGSHLLSYSGSVDSLVMILHGYGADGENLIDLGYAWQKILPNTEFIAPNAPTACEVSSFGYQWFSLQDWTSQILRSRAEVIAPSLQQYIQDCLHERQLTEDRLVLVGFSQGAMMAMMIGLELQQCAGILAYSGACLAFPPLQPRFTPPVYVIHGQDDTVIPVQAAHDAERYLQQAKVPVQKQIFAQLAHGINEQGLALGGQFIKQSLRL